MPLDSLHPLRLPQTVPPADGRLTVAVRNRNPELDCAVLYVPGDETRVDGDDSAVEGEGGEGDVLRECHYPVVHTSRETDDGGG